MVGGWRFLFEYIKCSASDLPRLDCFAEPLFIYQPTAGAVNDPHALLHFCERRRADESARVRSEWRMDCQKICANKNIVKRSGFNFHVPRLFRRDERIVGNDLHSERAGAARHRAADSPETNNTKRFALQFCPDKFL